MKTNKISYYELLGIIKDGKYPRIRYKDSIFHWDRFDYVDDDDDELKSIIYTTNWFEPLLEIIEDEFEDIEELKLDADFGGDFLINDEGNRCHISSHDKTIINRINKVIKNQKKIIERIKEE